MHQLITAVIKASSHREANAIAMGFFKGPHQELLPPFDSGTTLDSEDARFRDDMPDIVRETGAIRADRDEGMDLIETAWEKQLNALRKYYAAVETAVESEDFGFENILSHTVIKFEYNGTECSEAVEYALYQLGRQKGPDLRLYDETGRAIRNRGRYQDLREAIIDGDDEDDETDYYTVPLDVHY